MEKITIFTLDGCGHCSTLKSRLNLLGIKYKEIEVTQNNHVWDEIVKLTKYDYLPTVLIFSDSSTNANVYIPSVNYQTEDEIVEIIKNNT